MILEHFKLSYRLSDYPVTRQIMSDARHDKQFRNNLNEVMKNEELRNKAQKSLNGLVTLYPSKVDMLALIKSFESFVNENARKYRADKEKDKQIEDCKHIFTGLDYALTCRRQLLQIISLIILIVGLLVSIVVGGILALKTIMTVILILLCIFLVSLILNELAHYINNTYY